MTCPDGLFKARVWVNNPIVIVAAMDTTVATNSGQDLLVELPIPTDTTVTTFEIAGRPVVFIDRPQPYLLVTVPAAGFFDDHDLDALEALRQAACEHLRYDPTPTKPKLGLICPDATGDTDLLFRSRIAAGEGWHPGAAGSGLTTAASAAELTGNTPRNPDAWAFTTPVGHRPVARRVDGTTVLLTISIHVDIEGTNP
jgi:hypothetical protein